MFLIKYKEYLEKMYSCSGALIVPTFIMFFSKIYQRFKDHCLNELRVSFNHVAQKHSSEKVKGAYAVYVYIKLSVSYFILRSSNFWRKCPCTLKFGTHALKEMFLKIVRTFSMKLFVSKDNFLLTKLSINQNWSKSIKFIIAKTICFLRKRAHVFSKVFIRNMYSKLYSTFSRYIYHVFKLELLKVK